MSTKAVFSDVDSSGVAPELMAYLDGAAARPDMRALREQSYALAGLAEGQTVLDVGCGLGHAVAEMAAIVGPSGRVLGIELSAAMATEAARRIEVAHAEVRVGDLLELDFPDGSVDIARAERVLQHVTATERACAELVRVVRPGGWVVAIDPDWTSLRVVGPDRGLVEEVGAAWLSIHPNPDGVLRLRGALLDAGCSEVTTVPATTVHDDLAGAAELLPSLNPNIPESNRPIGPELGERWFAALDGAQAAGRFWCALQFWTVVGRKT